MGKLLDWALTDDWEEFQRIQVYKKLGKLLDRLGEKDSDKNEYVEIINKLKDNLK
jgi:hypothetical protein